MRRIFAVIRYKRIIKLVKTGSGKNVKGIIFIDTEGLANTLGLDQWKKSFDVENTTRCPG